MATGYTYDIYEGKKITLEQYALKCARAFMYSMRDEPMDAPIPDIEDEVEDSHHIEQIAKAEKDVARYAKMTVQQAGELLKKQREDSAKEKRKYLMEAKDAFLRYNSMLVKVEHWKVPKELDNLKKFMMEQLTESIKFDCSAISRVEKEEEDKMTPRQYLTFLRENAQNDVDYHTEAYKKELEVAKQNAAWVKALKGSVKGLK